MRLTTHSNVLIIGLLIVIAGFLNTAYCFNEDKMAIKSSSGIEKKYSVITGIVKEAGTVEGVIGASVELMGYRRGAVSDVNGVFRIARIIPGIYSLRIRCIGYETRIVDNIKVGDSSKVSLIVEIIREPIRIKDVVVTPATFAIMQTESAARQSLSRDDIETVPQLGEDIYRAVNNLPGLVSNDFSSKFIVRGGEHEEILVLMDGVELYEPFHIKDINEGALSIIDAEAIEGIDITTGGFTAEYGNRNSGVFKIDTKKSWDDISTYSIGVSLMNFRVMTEGIYDNNKGAWFLSARRGYLDAVLRIMKEDDVPRPKYHDFLFTTQYQVHPNHTLSLGRLSASDEMAQDGSMDVDRVDTEYGNSYFWISLKSLINRRFGFNTTASVGKITYDRFGYRYNTYFNSIQQKGFEVNEKRSFNDLSVKQNWRCEINDRLWLKFGFETKQLSADYDYRNFYLIPNINDAGVISFDSTRVGIDLRNYGRSISSYISSRFKTFEPLLIELGVRYDKFTYSNDEDISPRVNGMYRIKENTVLRCGWGRFYQSQGIHELAVWDGKSTYWRSQLAEHWTVGFEHFFSNQIQLRLEGYYKSYSRIRPSYENWDTGIEAFPEIEEERMEIFSKSKIAKGLEIFVRRDAGESFSFWANYTLAFAEESIDSIHFAENNMPAPYRSKVPLPYDQRHSFYFNINYRPNSSWSLNLSWIYHTGWPYTDRVLDIQQSPEGILYYRFIPDSLRSGRLPDFHRLNLRLTKDFKTKSGDFKIFVEFINLYNRDNIFAYDTYELFVDQYDVPHISREPDYWFHLLPSIGICWNGEF